MADKHTRVARSIDAPPETVWTLLADGGRYPAWNPTVIEMSGPHRMVWSDGMPLGLFRGVRTFELQPDGGGSEFTMSEVFSGPLSGLITKAIPDLTESFDQFADALKAPRKDGSGPDPVRELVDTTPREALDRLDQRWSGSACQTDGLDGLDHRGPSASQEPRFRVSGRPTPPSGPGPGPACASRRCPRR
jgi:hypothetical protein